MALAENLADVQAVLAGTAPAAPRHRQTEKKTISKPVTVSKKCASDRPGNLRLLRAAAAAVAPVAAPVTSMNADELWARVNDLSVVDQRMKARIDSFRPVDTGRTECCGLRFVQQEVGISCEARSTHSKKSCLLRRAGPIRLEVAFRIKRAVAVASQSEDIFRRFPVQG